MRDDEIGFPSSALTKSTVTMARGLRPFLERISFISEPLFEVSELAMRASTSSEITVGPYDVVSLLIS
jgi:hypothetical protein